MTRATICAFGLALASACNPASHDGERLDAAPPLPSASSVAPTAAKVPPPEPRAEAWSGTYTSAPGSLFVYDGGEWKGVHFRGDDAATGLGDGTLSLTLDPRTGIVRGNGTGALGDIVVSGAVTAGELTFSVLRKDPSDRGFTGTGVGKLERGTAAGTMRLSQGDAHVIRDAKFSLTKSTP